MLFGPKIIKILLKAVTKTMCVIMYFAGLIMCFCSKKLKILHVSDIS